MSKSASLPDPEPGLVLNYSYLWKRQAERGAEEGAKDRPAVIVLAQSQQDGGRLMTVVPVTSSRPGTGRAAIEIPDKVAKHLGLTAERSWVVVDEVNRFVWPGPDLRPLPGTPSRFAYGVVPPKLFARIKAELLAAYNARRLRAVTRTP